MSSSESSTGLRTVVIGAGAGVFNMHRDALSTGLFQVIGVSDVNLAGAEARGAELGCPAYTDHRQLLADLQPEVAVIIAPHPFHAAITIDALEAGAHVLVEKPIAVQAAEADAMIAAAEAADRLLAVNFQQRYRPEVRAAHEIIRSGKLGELQYANMVVVWPRTRRYFANAGWRGTWKGEGGGVLLNQAPHNLDLLCHLMGMPTSLVAWTRTRVHAIETEDTVQAMFEWDNGAVGSLHVSTAESGQPERLEILGTAGRLEVGRGHIVLQEFDQDVRTFFVETDAIYSGPPSHDVAVTLPESNGDHVDVYADLQRAITTGTPLMADGRDARMSLELANAMILSSYQQGAVSLPLDRAAYGTLLAQLQEA